MTQIKKIGRLALIIGMVVCLAVCTLFMSGAKAAYADEETGQETPVTGEIADGVDKADGSGENGLQELVEGFLAQLKEKYGDDYEAYYNAILEKWGSVEAYLLSLADEETDVAADGWTSFVHWLGEYAPIWGSILAIAAIIIVIVLGKKALNKVMEFAVLSGGKFKTLFAELNKMENAQIAQNHALEKLLGKNEQYEEQRKDLEKTVEEIKEYEKL